MALSWTALRLMEVMPEYGGDAAAAVVRELASNAIRALDAVYFGGGGKSASARGLAVRLRRFEDGEGRVWLSVADSGCGMTRGDVINRLATPGANRADRGDEAEWKRALAEGEAARLMDELGAGVFGAFAVADRLRVATRNVDDDAYGWEASRAGASLRGGPLEAEFAGGLESGGVFPAHRGTVVSARLRPECRVDEEALGAAAKRLSETSQYSIAVVADWTLDAELDDEPPAEEEPEEVVPASEEAAPPQPGRSYAERAKFVPLRLSYEERKLLRLVESAVKVSGYVDRVDAAEAARKPARRKQLQLQGVTSLLTGLVVAVDYDEGRRVAQDREFADRGKFLRRCFEVARRYKILNPEKMRSEYGQLVYLLQDAASIDELKDALGMDLSAPVRTVYSLLRDRGGLPLLDDPLVRDATQEVLPDPGKSRAAIQQAIKRKEHAVKLLARRYASDRLSPDDVELCLCSICDNESYLNSNRLPIDQTLAMLRDHFHPDDPAAPLAIHRGDNGARLSHSHARQFRFAEQSLSLWRAIVDDMFRLWHLAEADLLSGDAPYDLRDTGQGLQRVQACPRTYSAMLHILTRERADAHRADRRLPADAAHQHNGRDWVGSAMVHMGDHAVPNALTFLDKYAQVARILRPLVTVLHRSLHLCDRDAHVKALVHRKFGSVADYKRAVLADFFRHAFDGSGADNFYDAGSCVDGRLTSAWNWCSQISTKPYYLIFKLAGFAGFDGDW